MMMTMADFINIQEGAYSAESQSISKVYDIKDKIKNMVYGKN